MREHLKTLLHRLGERKIHHGVTLLDAFAYIAAMHAEGLTFLSRPVLAQALGLQVRELKPKVLGPLGKEAAAVGAGRFLLTRHRTIARCALEVLSEVFQLELDEVYAELAYAAKTARREQGFIPELDPRQWEVDLPKHFLTGGREGLALRIGRRLLDANPDDIRTRVYLAKLYREADAPEEAVRLFREHTGKMDRGALYEWGISEGETDDQPHAAWLEALSLADQAGGPPPDNNQAKLSLAGLGVTFEKLFAAYNDRVFVEGCGAVGVLGLTLPLDAKARGYFDKHLRESRVGGVPAMDVDTAFERFEAAVRAVGELCDPEDPLANRFARPEELSFQGLRRLIEARRGR